MTSAPVDQVVNASNAPLDVENTVPSDQQTTSEKPNETGLADQTNYVPPRKIIAIFLACATVGTTGLLDETMIAVALPIISADIGGGSQITWVATAFFMCVSTMYSSSVSRSLITANFT